MAFRLSALRRLHRGSPLALLAAAAMVLRLMLPMGPMAAPSNLDPVLAELLAGGGICHGDPDAPARAPAQKGIACVLCPICVAPLPVLVGAVAPLPVPAVVATGALVLWPPATAPPIIAFRPANPRAPPALSA